MPFILIYDIVQLSTLVKLRTDVVYLTLVSWANWISFSERLSDYDSAVNYTLDKYKYTTQDEYTKQLHSDIVDFYVKTIRSFISEYELKNPYYVTYELLDNCTLSLQLYYMPFTIKRGEQNGT
jgi:hypothetical protein